MILYFLGTSLIALSLIDTWRQVGVKERAAVKRLEAGTGLL